MNKFSYWMIWVCSVANIASIFMIDRTIVAINETISSIIETEKSDLQIFHQFQDRLVYDENKNNPDSAYVPISMNTLLDRQKSLERALFELQKERPVSDPTTKETNKIVVTEYPAGGGDCDRDPRKITIEKPNE